MSLTCEKFKSKCLIYASCCNEYVCCKICHDQKKDHSLKNKNKQKLLCLNCDEENQLSNQCTQCHTKFNNNYCSVCKIWTNLDIYHCDKCDVCRIGKKESFIHCDKCDNCYLKDTIHPCENIINKDLTCQICFDTINKTEECKFLRCGHTMHYKCFDIYKSKFKGIFRCGLCQRSIFDPLLYEKSYDKLKEKYPYYIEKKVNYHCNDCNQNGELTYHPDFNKCSECRSYNTFISK